MRNSHLNHSSSTSSRPPLSSSSWNHYISFAKKLSTFTYKTLLHVFSSYDGRNHRINSYVVWTLITWSYLTTWDFRDGTADGMTVTQNCTLYFDDDVLYNYNYVLCFHLYQSHVSHSQLLLIVLFFFAIYMYLCILHIFNCVAVDT